MDLTATLLVIGCWPVYIGLFSGRRERNPARQDKASMWGVLLQFSAVLIVWIARRPLFSPLIPTHAAVNDAVAIMATALAVSCVWISFRALQALGEQWRFVAGVGSHSVLVQHGPYRIVRHPLYMSFLGLTVATAVVWSTPEALLATIPLFVAGVWIRVRTEERLLRETFGNSFEDYVRKVPAVVPGMKRGR